MKVDKLFGRRGWRRSWWSPRALGVYAGAGPGVAPRCRGLFASEPSSRLAAAIRVTWFTDLPAAQAADPARDPCITATGELRIDDRFLGTASLVLNRREVLTVSHVPAVNGLPHDRFSLLLGYDRGRTAFAAEATVVAGAAIAAIGAAAPFRGGEGAVAVLDKAAPGGMPAGCVSGPAGGSPGRAALGSGLRHELRLERAPLVRGLRHPEDRSFRRPAAQRLRRGPRASGAPLLMREQAPAASSGSGRRHRRPPPLALCPADRRYGDLRPQISAHRGRGRRAPRCGLDAEEI